MNYEAIALKLVPPGARRTVATLRRNIAEEIEKQVNDALAHQLEKGFPELADIRAKMEQDAEDMKKKLKVRESVLEGKESTLEEMEATLRQREAGLLKQELAMANLIKAIEHYSSWLEGEGEVDESGKRFNALREACKQFKGGKK